MKPNLQFLPGVSVAEPPIPPIPQLNFGVRGGDGNVDDGRGRDGGTGGAPGWVRLLGSPTAGFVQIFRLGNNL